jgi:hypothetical protein
MYKYVKKKMLHWYINCFCYFEGDGFEKKNEQGDWIEEFGRRWVMIPFSS